MSKVFKCELHMRDYVSRLDRHGYPSTSDRLRQFNRTFLKVTDLPQDEMPALEVLIDDFNSDLVKNNIMPSYLKGKRRLEMMFHGIVDEYKKKYKKSKASSTNSSSSSIFSTVASVTQEKNNAALKKIETLEKQLEEMQDIYAKKEARHLKKINDMEKILTEKDGQLQQMKKEMEQMKEMAKVEDGRSQRDIAKQFLEEKVRSLEEIVKEKSEVLKACLRMQETLLHSVVNKSTPNDSSN